MNAEEQKAEWLKCSFSPAYWIHNYVYIYDATARVWIPFKLWRAQFDTLKTIQDNRLVIILKARQLGMTWLVLAFCLWLMLFHPIATILLFSKRDDEATYLLGKERMKGMYERLPEWQRARSVEVDNDHEWMLSNGSIARAFPTSAGDSYTATAAVVDEADLVPDLNRLMNAVKPTIDGGGRMILLSRVEKKTPQSEFKNIYRAAVAKINGWVSVFLPWWVRPERDQAWYEAQKADIQSRTTALDDLYQQYPATDTEALLPSTLDKRIAGEWLQQCYVAMAPLPTTDLPPEAPSIPGLEVYRLPDPDSEYVIAGDPAEGNPTSDDSSASILDRDTGEEVAALAGKYQPSTFAAYLDQIGTWYNSADVMVERNNHGHAVLLWLREHSKLRRLKGHDGKFSSKEGAHDKVPKDGWLSNDRGKAILYDACADAFRQNDTILHSFKTFTQLSLIEGETLRAPEGELDDRADSYALALVARDDRFNPAGRLAREAKKLREQMDREREERETQTA